MDLPESALRLRRNTVGALAEHRRAAGLSQTEVAARMGTSQSTVARLEAGDVDPRLSTLDRYAAALGGELDVQLSFRTDIGFRPNPVVVPDVLPLPEPTLLRPAAAHRPRPDPGARPWSDPTLDPHAADPGRTPHDRRW